MISWIVVFVLTYLGFKYQKELVKTYNEKDLFSNSIPAVLSGVFFISAGIVLAFIFIGAVR